MTTILNNIPQGYKATALGVIPQEWKAMRLGDVCTLINGRAYKQNELLSQGKYKILRVGNFFTNESWYFSDMELDSSKYAFKGDLLYAWSASFGPRFWTGDQVIYHYHIWKICNYRGVDQQYLYYFLDYDASLLQRDTQGGTMHHITKQSMEKRFIPVPPLGEQRKIAEVLGVWDLAIAKQVQLVERLTQRKRGLMQRLLTGKKRLHGFNGEWQKVVLSSVIEKLSNGYVYDVNSIGRAPITRIETISKGLIDYTKTGYTQYVKELEKYKLQDGDILFSHINSIAHIGKVAIFKGDKELYHGMNLLLIRAKETVNKNYLYYFLSSAIARKKVRSIAKQSVNQSSVNTDELKKWAIRIPEVEEQTAIAEVLTAADREIELAQAKLELYRRQKRGLMQQLLTGKKRIKYE